MACRLAKLQLGRCARVIHRDIYSHLEKVALRGGAEGYKTTFKEGLGKIYGGGLHSGRESNSRGVYCQMAKR